MRSKLLAILVALVIVATACAPPAAEVIEKEVIVEKEVPVTVMVEKEVVVEKVVTATPLPPGFDKRGGTMVMGFYQEPELLNDLIRTQTVADIVGNFFERALLGVSLAGEYVPDLAKEVPTIQNGGVSEDGLTVTYYLKEGVVWSDGDPFDCQDVVFTWETSVHPDSGAVSTSGYTDIESVSCPDPHTAVLNYSKFYAPYLMLFSSLLPSHIGLDPAKMQEWEWNRTCDPGLGPFVVEEWVSGDHMTIVRNENYEYWETEGKPYLDAIILRWIESREVGKQLIQTGELDFVWDLIEADLPEAEKWEGVVISAPPSTGTERLLLNLRDPELDAPCKEYLEENPSPHWALGDPKVCEAIELGIDKQTIVDKLLYGYASVGTTELNLGWAKPTIPETPYDAAKAKSLLEEAGWTDTDGDGIRECHGCPYADEGKVLKLKIQTTSGNALREQCQQVLMEMMADIGIQFYIENVPSSELFGSYSGGAFRKHGQFDILMYTTSYGLDPHSHQYGYFGGDSIPCDDNSGTGFNYSRWIDEEADAATEVAGSSPDINVRAAAYQTLAERIAEGRPHIYLYDRGDIDLLREHFKGYAMNIWLEVSWNAEEWYIEK